MKVFHNSARKLIVQGFLVTLTLLIFGTNIVNSQNRSEQILDWTLPFHECTSRISDNTNVERVASDNDGFLQLLSSTGSFQSYDVVNKSVAWTNSFGSEFISNHESAENHLFLASKIDGNSEEVVVRAISKLTGITIWQTLLPFSEYLLLKRSESHLNVVSKNNVTALSLEKGTKSWSTSNLLGFGINDFDGNEQKSYEKTQDLILELLKSESLDLELVSANLVDNESVVVGSNNGDLDYFLINDRKKIWSMKAGGEITSINKLSDNSLLVGSLDNFLYRYSAKSGNLVWKRRLPFRIGSEPLIANQTAIVANKGSDAIFFVNLESGKLVNQIILSESQLVTGNILLTGSTLVIPTTKGVFVFRQFLCGK